MAPNFSAQPTASDVWVWPQLRRTPIVILCSFPPPHDPHQISIDASHPHQTLLHLPLPPPAATAASPSCHDISAAPLHRTPGRRCAQDPGGEGGGGRPIGGVLAVEGDGGVEARRMVGLGALLRSLVPLFSCPRLPWSPPNSCGQAGPWRLCRRVAEQGGGWGGSQAFGDYGGRCGRAEAGGTARLSVSQHHTLPVNWPPAWGAAW